MNNNDATWVLDEEEEEAVAVAVAGAGATVGQLDAAGELLEREAAGFAYEKRLAEGTIFGYIAEIVGEDTADLLDMTPKSRFLTDLGMDSLEIIKLADKINKHYGDRVNFIAWLSRKPLKQIMLMTVGDVAEVIADAICQGQG